MNTTVSLTLASLRPKVSLKPTNGHFTGHGIYCDSGTGRAACSMTLNNGTGEFRVPVRVGED